MVTILTEKALALMEDTYSDFLMKKINAEKFEKNLSAALSALPLENGYKHFEVSIVNQNHKDAFFGFYLYPVMSELEKFTEDAVENNVSFKDLCKRWKTIKDWYIEIDAICFDRNIFNFTPKELTAMTLHEVGHTIYSDRPIERYYRAFQDAKSRMKLADKASMKVLYALYSVPLAISCMQKSWVDGKNRIKVEMAADKALQEFGYQESLISALDKIIKATGSINQSETSKDQAVDNSVNWCNLNVADLTRRRDKMKDELYYQAIRTQSGYFKALTARLLNELGIRMREKYTGYVVENTVALLEDPDLFMKYTPCFEEAQFSSLVRRWNMAHNEDPIVAMEMFGKNKVPKLPSQYDIDAIAIEIDKITTHYDRTYVLDLIYKVLDDIAIYEEYIQSTDPSKARAMKGKIASMRKELDELRKACLAKKNLDRNYRLFVKYPPGYEG